MANCRYIGPDNTQCTGRGAKSRDGYCQPHWQVDIDPEDSQTNEIIDTLLENPNVQRGVQKVNSLLDKFSNLIDRAAKGDIPFFSKPPQKPKVAPTAAARALLHFGPTEPLTEALIKERRRALARLAHPDLAGSAEEMTRINKATQILLESLVKPQ